MTQDNSGFGPSGLVPSGLGSDGLGAAGLGSSGWAAASTGLAARPTPTALPDWTPTAGVDLRDEVVEVLRHSLVAVIGPEAVNQLEVTARTRLFSDLGLDSIEFLQVAERVQRHYGVDPQLVVDRIAQIPPRQMAQMTVGDVVEMIADGLR
ncbi:MAG: acyl carrier protein [Propionibacteriaceae bacterium]|jgi:acyl carrier protein|nr:acyl carrier protein [Propionibacteriaceae bacterium]